ncbi:MAG: hypothetical protein LWW93_15420 [Hyphomicrobiales bacterium]|nr:hypothetical protein [Hyphomicrobiales bacterium]
MTEVRGRPDFLVLGPATPPDPHIELKLLEGTLPSDLGTGRDRERPRRMRPAFVGDEGAAFLPSIPANDRGLHLWSETLVDRMRKALADPPVDFHEADIFMRGRSEPLPERYFVVVPHVVHADVIDHEASARLWPPWGETPRPAFAHPDRIVLRADFAPKEAVFGLDFLGSSGLALHPDFEAKLCGWVNLWHTWAQRISEIRLGAHPATEFPTPSDDYSGMLISRVERLLSPPKPKPSPPRPASMDEARALCLDRVRAMGGLSLSSNRESWSRLVVDDGAFLMEGGDVDADAAHVRTLSEEEAWSLICERIFDDLGLYRSGERDAVSPETMVARLFEMAT